ncbi:MAG: hypothetical protein J0H15_12665 [Xanthomonadales bacterium]|nr:hypothetical protein [Xanthomonadales bacterium]
MVLSIPAAAFEPDAVERALPDPAAARAALGAAAARLDALLALQRERFGALAGERGEARFLERCLDALALCHARLAFRHGTLGDDFHAYHNEGHIAEICGGRIGRLSAAPGADALDLRDWGALLLFGAAHDLRQRESGPAFAGIGANECASLAEAWRILDACGFSREADADTYLALELMIAGSTFDAAPLPGAHRLNAADLVQSGGALAARLDRVLDGLGGESRQDARVRHALDLALIAADLDTANVAEPLLAFADGSERLCRERERLAGRELGAAESARPVLAFLTAGQLRFFFELHDFHSDLGRAAFAAGKQANAAPLRALALGVRARLAVHGIPPDGEAVIAAWRAGAASVAAGGRAAPPPLSFADEA